MKTLALFCLKLFVSIKLLGAEVLPFDELSFKQALFTMPVGAILKEITSDILSQAALPLPIRQTFIEQRRRFFVFCYPSDQLPIKSLVSFVETKEEKPLILLLRGASRMEALPAFLYPSKEILFSAESDAILVVGCYRDGVSDGVDEFGGEDVNDVMHLTEFLPTLVESLSIKADPNRRCMIGLSRGGMQMFLSLAKFPELARHFQKFVSFSGILNMDLFASNNPEWVQKMQKHFAFDGSQSWLNARNPILAIPKILNKELPFLIVQGSCDPKICLEEGYSMLKTMRQHGFKNISYWEVEGGDHCLKNHSEYIPLILNWLNPMQK